MTDETTTEATKSPPMTAEQLAESARRVAEVNALTRDLWAAISGKNGFSVILALANVTGQVLAEQLNERRDDAAEVLGGQFVGWASAAAVEMWTAIDAKEDAAEPAEVAP